MRMPLVVICCLVMSGVACCQLSPYPSWVHDWSSAPQSQVGQWQHPLLGQLHSLTKDETYFTLPVSVGKWSFEGISTSGVIAVRKTIELVHPVTGFLYNRTVALGGLATGYVGILCVAPALLDSFLSGHEARLVIVGIKADGRTGVSVLLADGQNDPSESLLLDLPVTSQPGEIFLVAGFIGPYLYIYDGGNDRFLRYLDANGDSIPETRDPSFSLTLESAPGFNYFVPNPNPECLCALEIKNAYEATGKMIMGIVSTAEGYKIDLVKTGNAQTAPVITYPRLVRMAVGGAKRLMCMAPRGATIGILGAATASGPFEPLGPTFAVPADKGILVTPPLASPLVAGQYIKTKNHTLGVESPPILVRAQKPVVFSLNGFSWKGGESIQVDGENLHLISGAKLAGISYVNAEGELVTTSMALRLAQQSPTSLTIPVPALPAFATARLKLSSPSFGTHDMVFLVNIRQP